MTLVEKVAVRVKQIRKRRGLTQRELAARVGIHRVNLAKIEAGRWNLTLATLERLAKALRVKASRLLE